MLPAALWLLCVTALEARAQTTTNEFYSTTFETLSTISSSDFDGTRYTYISVDGQSTVETRRQNATATSSSNSQITKTATSKSVTLIGGLTHTSNGTQTASSTSTAPRATNTIPCNGYPEFCQRKYSNITNVCAHNSVFSVDNNAGSNQEYPIQFQLDDGVRMLQGETHWVNDTVYNCHTSCDLLNAGTFQSSLETVASWLDDHPYDVVTWLIVNSDMTDVENYVPAIQNSGIARYLYEPEYVPQRLEQWPTLAEMILSGKRMVLFMDYKANQTAVPYVLNQFHHIWETPFSPTDQNFPCTQQRPPNLGEKIARNHFMYLANHNLNTAVDLGALIGGGSGEQILIPNTAEINQTNGMFDKFGQLERMSQNCTEMWGRPPNFLLVDYYNLGKPGPGAVFEVAAKANGVTYNRQCCGMGDQSAAPIVQSSWIVLGAALVFAVLLA
ncbi:uncharacterized protein LTR77_004423 [Saxophila tyrrhenica]|uniref:PLC-like phosphodiesterase n=1 Tax=Saxophila tyrrhenica TaxID=1690608 RepID=A0AAV9PF66_9PEZI|nr:hypothetical protein LTR77_004423 [Saxophila tyrrhenica]